MPVLIEGEVSTFVGEKYGVDQRTAAIIAKNMNMASIRDVIEVAGLVDNLNDPH